MRLIKLPKHIILKIFKYVDIIDLVEICQILEGYNDYLLTRFGCTNIAQLGKRIIKLQQVLRDETEIIEVCNKCFTIGGDMNFTYPMYCTECGTTLVYCQNCQTNDGCDCCNNIDQHSRVFHCVKCSRKTNSRYSRSILDLFSKNLCVNCRRGERCNKITSC